MKKRIKIVIGIFILFGTIILFLYGYKEDPRCYLNDRINIAYINEEIETKNFEKLIQLLKNSEIMIDETSINNFKYIKGIYLLGEKNFITEKTSCVGIIDFGYWYPLVIAKIDRYFYKEKNYYVLRESYSEKYFKNKKMYLKIDNGNFFISENLNEIENILKNEDEASDTLLKIVEREKDNNLGMLILNLEKNPLIGFDELVVTGDINSDKDISLYIKIAGDNEIINSFSESENEKILVERTIEKNRLYLKKIENNELKSFIFFLNYFLNETKLDKLFSKIDMDNFVNIEDSCLSKKNSVKKIAFGKDYFIYGDIEIKNKLKKNIGEINIVGVVKKQKLQIDIKIKEKVMMRLLNLYKVEKEEVNTLL